MDDLLKEAIADAKAVRETALENAKIALEEAFTPRLQSMLSKKIQSEMDHDDEEKEEGYHEDEEMEEDEMEDDNDGGVDINIDADNEDEEPAEGMHDEDEEMEEEGMHDEDEDMDETKVIEINGVKYAPVVSEEEDDEKEEGYHEDEEMEENPDLDLEAVIKELESEIDEGEHEEDKEDVEEEVDATSGIGSSDNKNGSADKSSAIGTKDKAKFESVRVTEEEEDDKEEDIDLEEVLKALSEEEDDEEKKEDEKNEIANLQSDLDEHRNVVKYLRSKLNEVNLLNAKLLFTNKLFRSHGLTNEQKMKVVETFDRAANLREVKLVYSTLAESFGSKQTKNQIKESKGSASKVVASTKSKKSEVISEGSELKARFKKLAGIL
jgi:hypothetical protein